jgi:hypothetical protein
MLFMLLRALILTGGRLSYNTVSFTLRRACLAYNTSLPCKPFCLLLYAVRLSGNRQRALLWALVNADGRGLVPIRLFALSKTNHRPSGR